MKKNAQTEIIGLVIIVIIVTIAMLFYLASAANKLQEDVGKNVRREYAFNEQATSFIDTLVDTSVCGVTYRELLIDCGSAKRIICPGGLSSCQQIERTTAVVVDQTLAVWQQPFLLNVSIGTNEYYAFGLNASGDVSRDGGYLCSRGTVGRGAPGIFLIPYFPRAGNAQIELGICKVTE